MGHSHSHGHSHGHTHGTTAAHAHRGRLAAVLGLTLTVMVVEVIGGIASGSFALVADAGHMLTDAAGVALALGATALAARPATAERTFGWQRAEMLAALVNGLLILVVGVLVLAGGVRRIVDPQEVEGGLMLVVACVGLVANGIGLVLLVPGQRDSLNVRGAYLEVLGDLLGSAAVVVAALVVLATGFERADGVASVLIGLMILPRAVGLLRQVATVLLEATPTGVDLAAVRAHICGVPGVVGVHDLHAWTITSGVPVLSAHVEVPDAVLERGEAGRVLDDLRGCLAGHFDVDHCTFQLEPPSTGTEPHTHA
ncbi:cation diffusion facilitator family transporter [Cellulomonas sp. PhB150]|uniref:cation diffusion facilitator family transporter n=1 Tax=Cellulomonas sp. PhB150 TaxID=2485188 RepID=UPI000F471B08|nr:cation diffusion facilitator family transporter [Cellulomonas sp. PhB150]ROS31724.1 cobalt-zinc-cadmium efflux system protein [Cellulomonas sp. PhB150]